MASETYMYVASRKLDRSIASRKVPAFIFCVMLANTPSLKYLCYA